VLNRNYGRNGFHGPKRERGEVNKRRRDDNNKEPKRIQYQIVFFIFGVWNE
jgi:hypothetical protein